MKIIAVVESKMDDGGGFNQSVNAISQISELAKNNFEFEVITSYKKNIQFLKAYNIKVSTFRITFLDQIISLSHESRFFRRIWRILGLIAPFERRLKKLDCDLVYFLAPSSRPTILTHLNYIMTIWDTSHRDTPEFPEVRGAGEFLERENILKNIIPSAYLVLVDSTSSKASIHNRYGVDLKRLVVMPFSPNPFLQARKDPKNKTIKHYELPPNYFIYPAQFWAHKNHILIIKAIKLLKDKGVIINAVFVGGDKGNKRFVQKKIKEYNLENQIKVLGFIPSDHLYSLYRSSVALVMPTYFGYTNIPPLEAWDLKIPVIYSKHLSKYISKAVLPVDVTSEKSLADAFIKMRNEKTRDDLKKAGTIQLLTVNKNRKNAEKLLLRKLKEFSISLQTWQ